MAKPRHRQSIQTVKPDDLEIDNPVIGKVKVDGWQATFLIILVFAGAIFFINRKYPQLKHKIKKRKRK